MPGSLPLSNARPSIAMVVDPPPPDSGTIFEANVACTPGSASTRRRMSSVRWTFDFGDDQRVAQRRAPAASRATTAFLERLLQICLRRLQRGRQPENDPGQPGDD